LNSWTKSFLDGDDNIHKDEEEVIEDREKETREINTISMTRKNKEEVVKGRF